MAIFSNWKQCVQQWTTITTINIKQQYNSESSRGHGRADNKSIRGLDFSNTNFTITNPGEAFQFTQTYDRLWSFKSNSDSKSHRSNKRNRHHKYLYPVALCLTNLAIAPATLAADVGGVSATANPIAQFIELRLPTKQFRFYKAHILPTLMGVESVVKELTANFTPYITHARNNKDPFETFYLEPQYDARDFKGRKVEVQKNVKNW